MALEVERCHLMYTRIVVCPLDVKPFSRLYILDTLGNGKADGRRVCMCAVFIPRDRAQLDLHT